MFIWGQIWFCCCCCCCFWPYSCVCISISSCCFNFRVRLDRILRHDSRVHAFDSVPEFGTLDHVTVQIYVKQKHNVYFTNLSLRWVVFLKVASNLLTKSKYNQLSVNCSTQFRFWLGHTDSVRWTHIEIAWISHLNTHHAHSSMHVVCIVQSLHKILIINLYILWMNSITHS